MQIPTETSKYFYDPSLWGLLASNLFSIFLCVVQGWPMGEILWVYWGQSVIIGITNAIRILNLKEFSTDGLLMNGQPVPATEQSKRSTAAFFCMHYGIFHLAYAVFLGTEFPLKNINAETMGLLGVCLAAFAASHFFSLRHNQALDFAGKKPNLGTLLFYPYLWIIPMHLTIIFGGLIGGAGMVLFMVLKTIADLLMHIVEHAIFRRPDISSGMDA